MFRICDGKLLGLPIQVILSVYTNVEHLLASFDVDCCACCYVPEKGVYCSPRALRALRYSVNIFDSSQGGCFYLVPASKLAWPRDPLPSLYASELARI